MKPLHEAETEFTFELYSKTCKNLQKKNLRMYILVVGVFCALTIYNSFMAGNYLHILYLAVIVAALIAMINVLLNKQLKTSYAGNPDAGAVIGFKFYEDYVICQSKNGQDKHYYRELHKITENDDEYCIFTERNVCYILDKKDCDSGLKSFIKKIKKEHRL